MTVLRYKNSSANQPAFNNLIGDLYPQIPSLFRDDFRQAIPVNVKERQTEYILEIIAPGFEKEDFQISLDKNLLTVSGSKKEIGNTEGEKLVRNEYEFKAFKRSFTLDEKIAAESISAQYVNGILTLNLPKREEVKPQTKQISVQ